MPVKDIPTVTHVTPEKTTPSKENIQETALQKEDIPTAIPVPKGALPPGTKTRWGDPNNAGETFSQIKAEELEGTQLQNIYPEPSTSAVPKEDGGAPEEIRRMTTQQLHKDATLNRQEKLRRERNGQIREFWWFSVFYPLVLLALLNTVTGKWFTVEDKPCTLSGLGWKRTVSVWVAYRSRENRGCDVPGGAWNKQYTGEERSGYETVVTGSRQICKDVPVYEMEYYTETICKDVPVYYTEYSTQRVCEEIYEYTKANAYGTGVLYKEQCTWKGHRSECSTEQKSRQVIKSYSEECRIVEDTEERPVYSPHYTWTEWVWTKESDITERGDESMIPRWPEEHPTVGYETRYERKSEEYWALIRDWDQDRNPGLSSVYFSGMAEYWAYLQHVGEPVFVRKKGNDKKISGISGLAETT